MSAPTAHPWPRGLAKTPDTTYKTTYTTALLAGHPRFLRAASAGRAAASTAARSTSASSAQRVRMRSTSTRDNMPGVTCPGVLYRSRAEWSTLRASSLAARSSVDGSVRSHPDGHPCRWAAKDVT